MEKKLFLIFVFSLFVVSGCAHVISQDLRGEADPSIALRMVQANPQAYKGKVVIWGGEVLETTVQKDGSTVVEVLQRPTGWQGEPDRGEPSEGRFMVREQGYLDPYIFRRGRKITVAGVIEGDLVKPLGEMQYRYPLLFSRQIHLWPEYAYTTPYYYPYYDPYWGPFWWRYPYPYRFHRFRR